MRELHDTPSRKTVKYGHESHGIWNKNECAEKSRQQFIRPSMIAQSITNYGLDSHVSFVRKAFKKLSLPQGLKQFWSSLKPHVQ
jgi:hypothetical protein